MPYKVFKIFWSLFISSLFVSAYGIFITGEFLLPRLGDHFYYLLSPEYREFWVSYIIDTYTVGAITAAVGFCVMLLCPREASALEKVAAAFFVLVFPLFLLIVVNGMLFLGIDSIFIDTTMAKYFVLFQVILAITYSLFVSKVYSPEKATSLSPNDMPDHSQSSELRDCPFCYEKIQQKAIKCRFCGEMV